MHKTKPPQTPPVNLGDLDNPLYTNYDRGKRKGERMGEKVREREK